jgi:hypothetical protein
VIAVSVVYFGTMQQQLRGVAAIEPNRLTGEILKRLFAAVQFAAKVNAPVDRVQRQVASGWRGAG